MTDEAIEQRKLEGKTPLHRVISSEEGERYARDHGFFFHESSPLIDADPNRNRTKNTVTQVWTTNSTANDAIQTTIARCCCKWNNFDQYTYPAYFPLDPLPPLETAAIEEQPYVEGGAEGGAEGYAEGGEEQYAEEGQQYAAAENELYAGEEQQYAAEEQQYAGEEQQYAAAENEQYAGEEEQYGEEAAAPVAAEQPAPVEAAPAEEDEDDDY